MNKRIKKKRARLSPRQIGYNVYTAEEMKGIIMIALLKHHLIPRIDEVIEIEVASWEDYRSNDKIEIKAKDGTTYLVHSSNVTLIHDES